METITNITKHFKDMTISPLSWLAGIAGILFTRFFLEALSNPSSSGFFAVDLPTLTHYSLFFISVALFIQIFLRMFLPQLGEHIPKIAVISLSGIFIAPIVDLLVNGKGASPMVYVLNSPIEVLKSAFYLFSANPAFGTTIGLQVEITIILLTIFVAIYFLSKNFGKALLGTLFFYAVLFTLCSMPSVIAFLGNNAGGPAEVIGFLQNSIESSTTLKNHIPSGFDFSSKIKMLDTGFNFMVARIFFFLVVAFAYIWFWQTNKKLTGAIIRNSRPERVGNYIFIIMLGILLALQMFPSLNLNWNDYLAILSLFTSLYFSAMFAVCINDIEDVEIDKLTNTDRPLVKEDVNPKQLKGISYLFLIASIISGYLAGNLPLFFIIVFTALYYIYSAPPTRFKLIPFFSSFIIGLCCIATFMAGFYIISPLKVVSILPNSAIIGIFLFFFLFWHVRDVKDIEGDRENKIPTVPVIFGKVWGRRVTGAISASAFLIIPLLSKIIILWLPAILATFFTYYFINRNPYSEKLVFLVYFLFIIVTGVVLFLPTI